MDNLLNYFNLDDFNRKLCTCDEKTIRCVDNDCNYCIHKDLIYSYIPFIQIIINSNNISPNMFDLQKNYYTNTKGTTIHFNIFINYLLKWYELSNNYNIHTAIITVLCLYNVVLNNKIILDCMYYIYEPFIIDLCKLLKLKLNSPKYLGELKEIFKMHFTRTPEENIMIMNKWLEILEDMINTTKESIVFFIN